MSNKERKVLGKGLSALISAGELEEQGNSIQEILEVEVSDILPNAEQPRKHFNEEELKGLASSIREYGILQPIVVRKMQGYYEIIAGERRWRAAKIAGLTHIPAIVHGSEKRRNFELALLENIQRANLSAIEEAKAYSSLLEQFGYTQDELAHKFGKSRSYIANAVRLLALPAEVQTMLEEGKISAGHARCLIKSDDPLGLANSIIQTGMSVRELERKLKEGASPKQPNKGNSRARTQTTNSDKDLLQLEEYLTSSLGIKVSIQAKGEGSGNVVIGYKDMLELDKIISAISNNIE